MDKDTLERIIMNAWGVVKIREERIIGKDISEWTVSASLCCELRRVNELEGWDVHAEYNRQGKGEEPKWAEIVEGGAIRPDIIIHRVGETEKNDNLLYIEVKKKNVRQDEDKEKCKEVTKEPKGGREFQYQYALLLIYDTEGRANYRWFKNGEEMNDNL